MSRATGMPSAPLRRGAGPRPEAPVDALAETLARTVASREPVPGPFAAQIARAVTRSAPPATQRMLARFEPGEHVQFGPKGSMIKVHGVEMEERYLIAMADFYESPEALMKEKPENITALKALIEKDERLRSSGVPKEQQMTEQEWTDWSKASGHKKGETYMDRNKANEGHFEGLNKKRWLKHHTRAMQVAQAAGNGSGIVCDEARIINGFANHFLTDAFSAGHQVNKVAMQEAAKGPIDNKANRVALANAIAHGLLADPKIKERLEHEEIKTTPVLGMTWGRRRTRHGSPSCSRPRSTGRRAGMTRPTAAFP
jgi:hypothetical protein